VFGHGSAASGLLTRIGLVWHDKKTTGHVDVVFSFLFAVACCGEAAVAAILASPECMALALHQLVAVAAAAVIFALIGSCS
jgi:hypothetical protein